MDLYINSSAKVRPKGFAGELVYPGNPEYDRRRAVWNAMHDRRPALIARCTSARDVIAAIAHGRAEQMEIAVRGGGHSMPGHSTCDDGIVIDLREMNAVRVDPAARRATVQGGTASWCRPASCPIRAWAA
jgi:FAD/FMN-containing dehydrogenase